MVEATNSSNAQQQQQPSDADQRLDPSTSLEHTYNVWAMVKQTRQ